MRYLVLFLMVLSLGMFAMGCSGEVTPDTPDTPPVENGENGDTPPVENGDTPPVENGDTPPEGDTP